MTAGPVETVVIDASVAAKWHLLDEEGADKALEIIDRFVQGKAELWAPSHIRYEVTSAITVATLGRKPRMHPDRGKEAIEAFLSLGLHTADTTDLILAAYALVHQHGCSLYDALYLALAQTLGVPLVTADRKFYERIRKLPNIVWIDSWSPQGG